MGGSATREIERPYDQDWFAVTLEAGKTYRIDLAGSSSGAGTMGDPFLRGVYNEDGNRIEGTSDDDWGIGNNSRLLFKPRTTGTYYIAAQNDGSRTGTYRLFVREISDDHPSDTSTTGTVEVDGAVNGNIERPHDRDWFAVTLEAGKVYWIDLEGWHTRAGSLGNPSLRGIYDEDGNAIAGTDDNDGGTFRNSRVSFEPETTGTYYIAAAESTNIGTYRLSVTELENIDDYPAGTGTTGTVAVEGSTMGAIERPNDQDWFAVTLEAGTTYRIDIEGDDTKVGTLKDPDLRGVYDTDGRLIGSTWNDNGGTLYNSRLFFEPQTAGTYYIAAAGDFSRVGTYRVSVREIENAPDDHPAGTSGTVAVNAAATGEIELSGDQDWFAVTLDAGKTYRINLEGSATNAGTLWLPHIHGLYDDYGILIGSTTHSGFGTSTRLIFEPWNTGTYYIVASAYQSWTGTYRVSVSEIDDYPADTYTTGRVAVDGTTTAEIERSGDQDWFKVILVGIGKTFQIDLEGSDTNAGTLGDPYLRGVYDEDGSLIEGTSDDNGGTGLNSRLLFDLETNGVYYIAVDSNGSGIGTYELSVEESL